MTVHKSRANLLLIPFCLFLLIFVISSRLIAAEAASGNEFFVTSDGQDTNPGTKEQPWRTITHANKTLQPGDTLYIRAGTYNEVIEPFRSGEPGKPITYTNYADEEVVIRGQPGEEHIVVIGWSINGPWGPDSYIIVDGLTLSYGHNISNKRFEWVFIYGAGSQYNVIRNCTIVREGDPLQLYQDGYREWGVVLDAAKHNLIENNTITGVNMGVHIKKAAQYNIIRGNTISATVQSAIVIASSKGVMQGNLIEGNILERSAIEDGIQFMQNYDAADPTTDISNLGTIIRNNIIRYNAENAIDLKGAAHVVIEGNIVYGTIGDNDGSSDGNDRNTLATIMRGNFASARDVIIRGNIFYDNSSGVKLYEGFKLYNNTIAANNRDYTGLNSDYSTKSWPIFWGLRQVGDRIAILNNIIIGHNIVEVLIKHASYDQSALNHNLYFNTDGPFFAVSRSNNEWDKLSFDEWQAHLQSANFILGKDEGSIVADPMFVNAPTRPIGEHSQFDFHLQAESPAIDAGGPLTWVKGSGSGIRITLDDAGYFSDGFGVTRGDLLQIGKNEPVRITAIDYGSNIITVERAIFWTDGMSVSLVFHGESPDIGANEFTGTKPPMFVDVPRDHLYYDEIKTLFIAGYTAGCNQEPLMFCPDEAMTRAESTVFVERGLWGTEYFPSDPTTQLFADLPLESWV